MMVQLAEYLGEWGWVVAGFVLMVLEILLPGIFLIWFGIAAVITGFIFILLPSSLEWQWQLAIFLVLAVLFPVIGHRFLGSSSREVALPLLNRRGEQMVGLRGTLVEPIVNGQGHLRISGSLWRITGPELPIGTNVIVTAFEDNMLVVEAE